MGSNPISCFSKNTTIKKASKLILCTTHMDIYMYFFFVKIVSLKKKKIQTLRGGLSGANASATNCGPKADPPMPTDKTCVKRSTGQGGGLIWHHHQRRNTGHVTGQHLARRSLVHFPHESKRIRFPSCYIPMIIHTIAYSQKREREENLLCH